MVVLRQGIPGNSQLGTPSTPGLYVRFKDGVVDTDDEKIIEALEKSQGFNSDFIKVEDTAVDPYASSRVSAEPTHTIKEMKYGHVESVITDKPAIKPSPELQKFIQDAAVAMAKEMLPLMVQETLKSLSASVAEEKTEKPKATRKTKKAEVQAEETPK
jgi:hypothetical protein